MVMVVVIILIRSFIQGFNTIVALLTSMLETSSLTDLSISKTQIMVEYEGIDGISSCSGDFDKKFYPKLQ